MSNYVQGPASATNGAVALFDGTGGKTLKDGVVLGTASGNIPQVGTKSATEALAGLVELATQAEAEAGTDDTVVMTALKTNQAIAAAQIAKAHVNFRATTSSIIGSLNTSSVTDVSTGVFTQNLTSGFAAVDFTVSGSSNNVSDGSGYNASVAHIPASVGTIALRAVTASDGGLVDPYYVGAVAFGDLS